MGICEIISGMLSSQLLLDSESKITAGRSRTFSICMCVCIFQQAPCNDMLLNSCVEKWFCEVWKSIGVIMYNQQPTVVSHFPLITEVWKLLNNIKLELKCTFLRQLCIRLFHDSNFTYNVCSEGVLCTFIECLVAA